MNITELITRVKVVLKSAITWLTIAAAVLTFVLQELKEVEGVPEWVTRYLASALGVITFIVLQVRAHTPVDDSQKGLLPPKGPGTPTLDAQGTVHDPDAGMSLVEGLIVVLVVFLLLLVFGVVRFR